MNYSKCDPGMIRGECVLCGNAEFEPIFMLPRFPTFMSTTSDPPHKDEFRDMSWSACSECNTVQLTSLPPLNLVYRDLHTENLGDLWLEHNEQFNRFVSLHAVPPVSSIERTELTGQALAQPTFSKRVRGTLVHSHSMEHWLQPHTVLEAIWATMDPGSRMIFSIPAMDALLEAGTLATLNFEHSFHLSRAGVRHLLKEAGFLVTETEDFGSHSIFFACQRATVRTKPHSISVSSSARLVREALAMTRRDIRRINRAIENFDGPVYVFGAHIFAQYVLRLGLHEHLINGILDYSLSKRGKRLYGTKLTVYHPTELKIRKPTMFIVRTGPYNTEIEEGLRNCFGGDAIFV